MRSPSEDYSKSKEIPPKNENKLNFINDVFSKMIQSQWVEGYFSAIMAWCVSFVLPLGGFLSLTAILVFCDFFTGVRAARSRGELIRSRGFFRTVEKIVLYFLAIMLSEGMKEVFGLPIPLTYMIAGVIALTEFKSNIENIEDITGTILWSEIRDKLETLFKVKK